MLSRLTKISNNTKKYFHNTHNIVKFHIIKEKYRKEENIFKKFLQNKNKNINKIKKN